MKKKEFFALGLMTGTSMDGVDLSLIKSDGLSEFTAILNDYHSFDNKFQSNLINLRDKISCSKDLKKYSSEILNLERDITIYHSRIINNFLIKNKSQVDLIGFHGQTIFHNSNEKISKQLGDGKLLSQIIKKIVVNNFRQKDLKNGGQGAPLTPIFHKLVSKLINKRHKISFPLNIINIGGITNITHLPNDTNSNLNIYSYDIGPGNCLIDEWIRKNSKEKFDDNGKIAKSGKVNDLILNQAIDNFGITSYGKSLDVKDFDLSFVKGLSLEDGCATITKFSAHLIAKGIESTSKINNSMPKINLICGGGRKNSFLIKSISDYLIDGNIRLENIDNHGFDGDFIESQAFGYLSIRSYLNLPISFPNTTRCKKETEGGEINKNF